MTISPYINQLLRLRISFDFQLLIVLFFYGVIKGIEYSFGLSFGLLTFAFFGITSCWLFIKALLLKDTVGKAKGILFIAFIGNDYYFFIYGLILLIYVFLMAKSIRITKINLFIGLFIFYAVCISVLNLISEFLFLNFLLSLILYSSFLLIPFIFSKNKTTQQDVLGVINFLESIIHLQILLIIVQSVFDFSFTHGDWGRGSLDSTDKSGFFIFLYLLVNSIVTALVNKKGLYKVVFKKPLFIVFMCFLIVLLDAKLIYLSMLAGLIVLLVLIILFLNNFSKHLNLSSLLLFAVSIGILVLMLPSIAKFYNSKILKEDQSIDENIVKYFNDPEYSQKYTLYDRTFSEMSKDYPIFSFFGVGMGKFGGKVSNAFAKDVLYKDPDNTILTYLPTVSSQWVKKYYNGLYTKEVYDTIKWRSANFSFPFAGLITIKVELGFVGLFLFLAMLFHMAMILLQKYFQINDMHLKKWVMGIAIGFLTIPIFMLFDNYQEFPQIMIPAFLFVSLVNNISASE